MNEIEWLTEQLKVQLPDAIVKIDEPHHSTGNHWLDVILNGKCVTVEYRQEQGFGFFAEDAGYGEGPNEIIPEKEKVLEKITSSFKTK